MSIFDSAVRCESWKIKRCDGGGHSDDAPPPTCTCCQYQAASLLSIPMVGDAKLCAGHVDIAREQLRQPVPFMPRLDLDQVPQARPLR